MKKIIYIITSLLLVSCELVATMMESSKDDEVVKPATEYQFVENVELNVNACYFNNMTSFIQVKDFSIFEVMRRDLFDEMFHFIDEDNNTELWIWDRLNSSIYDQYNGQVLVLFDKVGRVANLCVWWNYSSRIQYVFEYYSDDKCNIIKVSEGGYYKHKGVSLESEPQSLDHLKGEKDLFMNKLAKVAKAVEAVMNNCSEVDNMEPFSQSVSYAYDLMKAPGSPSMVAESLIIRHRVNSELISQNEGGFKIWGQNLAYQYLNGIDNVDFKVHEVRKLTNKKVRLDYSVTGLNDKNHDYHRSIAWVNIENPDYYDEVVIPGTVKDGKYSDVIEFDGPGSEYKVVMFIYPSSLMLLSPIRIEPLAIY